ncbi:MULTISPECIES: DUF4013 domain-containing protein [Methanothermococcus]|uniref:DUF4013 domain-containing protein n=1 Tax=Methanothermococcus TaxID=155862 RepID=UPI000360DA47|nr:MULTISPECIES: DUF4013 domain-containing protein [Methanothermococcus]
MFSEKYIKEPLNYAYSDLKKIFVGGVLELLSMAGMIFGFFLIIMGVMPYMPGFHMPMTFGTAFSGIGVLFGLVSLVLGVIFSVFVNGYYMKVIQKTLNNEDILPEWDNFKELFVKGLLYIIGALLLSMLFSIPYVILELVGVVYNIDSLAFILFSNLVSLIILILSILVIPLAIINFVAKDRFLGFFQFKEIISKISFEYVGVLVVVAVISMGAFLLWMMMIGLIVAVLYIINGILAVMGFALFLLTIPFLNVFLKIFSFRCYGKYYCSATQNK